MVRTGTSASLPLLVVDLPANWSGWVGGAGLAGGSWCPRGVGGLSFLGVVAEVGDPGGTFSWGSRPGVALGCLGVLISSPRAKAGSA